MTMTKADRQRISARQAEAQKRAAARGGRCTQDGKDLPGCHCTRRDYFCCGNFCKDAPPPPTVEERLDAIEERLTALESK